MAVATVASLFIGLMPAFYGPTMFQLWGELNKLCICL